MRHERISGAKEDRAAEFSSAEQPLGEDGNPAEHAFAVSPLSAAAIGQLKEMLEARRAREAFFGPNLFSDPAWDILLHAFVAEQDQDNSSIDETCLDDTVPATTSARWINKLEEDGWLVRLNDRMNSTRPTLKLSAAGKTAMERYLASFGRSASPL